MRVDDWLCWLASLPKVKCFEVKFVLHNACGLHSRSEDVVNCWYISSISYSI